MVDGRDFNLQGYEDGFFVGAHLFDNVTKDMDIYRVRNIRPGAVDRSRPETYEEALGLAMDHEYGNGTAIFTRDGDTARDFANRVNVGMVGINVPYPSAFGLSYLRRVEKICLWRFEPARARRV